MVFTKPKRRFSQLVWPLLTVASIIVALMAIADDMGLFQFSPPTLNYFVTDEGVKCEAIAIPINLDAIADGSYMEMMLGSDGLCPKQYLTLSGDSEELTGLVVYTDSREDLVELHIYYESFAYDTPRLFTTGFANVFDFGGHPAQPDTKVIVWLEATNPTWAVIYIANPTEDMGESPTALHCMVSGTQTEFCHN